MVAPLFVAERIRYNISIEGAFIGLARFLSRHPDPFGWYPYWYGGTPVQFTYTPGLHYLNAALIRLLPWLSPGQVFHTEGAAAYSLSAVTAAYLAYFFTRRAWWAFGAGMLASLWIPIIWLVRELRFNSGDFRAPFRLLLLGREGEAPHLTSVMLLPLAACALWSVAESPGFARIFRAALLMAAVVLINWLGAFSLAVVFAFVLLIALWQPEWRSGRMPALRLFAAAGLACLFAAFWITPSFVRTIAINSQRVNGSFEYRPQMVLLAAGAIAGLGCIGWLLLRRWQQPYLCFLALSSFFFGYLVLSYYWFGASMIPQPFRYIPEFELLFTLLLCELLRLAHEHAAGNRRCLVIAAIVALAIFAVWQGRRYLRGSYRMLRAAQTSEWVEYKLDRWLGEHARPEDRAFLSGSEGMSLNGWFDVSQAKGWFDPGVRHWPVLDLSYQITSGNDGRLAVDLLRVLGARYVVVTPPASSVAYHDYLFAAKFEGLLPAVFRLPGGETIYEVPGARLAHLVRPEELPRRTPVHGLDLDPLARYIAALEDSTRPALEASWLTPDDLNLRGDFPAGFATSVQVSHADGWRAYQGGYRIPVESDPMGWLVLHPVSEENGLIRLHYAGSLEQRIGGWISFTALATACAGLIVTRRRPAR